VLGRWILKSATANAENKPTTCPPRDLIVGPDAQGQNDGGPGTIKRLGQAAGPGVGRSDHKAHGLNITIVVADRGGA